MKLAYEALAVLPATVAFTECLVRCPLAANARVASEVTTKSLRVLSSRRISEHWKEAVLPRYSALLLVASCLVGLWLIVCLTVFLIVFALTKCLLRGEWRLALLVPTVLETVLASVVGVFYGLLRAKRLSP